MKSSKDIEALLINALRNEPKKGLPFGFARMVTRKIFSKQIKPLGIGTYGLVLVTVILLSGASLGCLWLIIPQTTEYLFGLLLPARYILLFVGFIIVIFEFLDQRWVRTYKSRL